MNMRFRLRDRFGSFLSDGNNANIFRFTYLEPALTAGESIVLDFREVTNMTTSFSNALIATLLARHSDVFFQRVRFENCNSVIRELILFSLMVGRRESEQKQAA